MQVSQTILQQLGGGNRLKLFTGAKDFVGSEDRLTFKIGKGAKEGINRIVVILNGLDLYDVQFYREWGMNLNLKKEVNNIYNDMLVDTFEKETGFFLSM